jgi:hypothetical protein
MIITNQLSLIEFFYMIVFFYFFTLANYVIDRLCGIVCRHLGYRYRGPGLDSRLYQILCGVGMKRGTLSLMRK